MRISNKQKVIDLLKSIETGAEEPIGYINANNYIQHNQSVADGLTGFKEILKKLPEGTARADVVRVFEDGDYVIAHSDYNCFGPKVGFDIFRFEDGKIVEHWDNLQDRVFQTVSDRSQIDGYVEVKDLDKREENKALVKRLLTDIFLGTDPNKITDYISTEQYDQHNPVVDDGVTGLDEGLQALAEAGTPIVYEKIHTVLGEGNFVLSVSEGVFLRHKAAFYDLFRIENGRVVEHWDTIERVIPDSEAKNSNGKFNF